MQRRRSIVPILLVLALASCAKAPPTLSPTGVAAYNATRVVKALDVLRDAAIAANAQAQPLLSTANTRLVVNYHESAVKTIGAIPNGWKAIVEQGLTELQVQLGAEYAQIAPYVNLVKTLIAEVQ